MQERPMQGKICLVTGATRGLGQATALGLARMGAQVVIVGRSHQRIDDTLAFIRHKAGSSHVEGIQADLSSQAEVRRAAVQFLDRYPHLDVLINNVGATLLRYQSSPDGFEMTWALNYLNHFLTTYLLLGALKTAAAAHGEARIVEVTSNIYRLSSPHFDRLQTQHGYNGVLAYGHSKRAINVFTGELARRLQGSGVTINAVTPGAVRTDIARENGWLARLMMRVINHFALSPESGAKLVLRLATSRSLYGVSGKFFKQNKLMPDDPTCHVPEEVSRLWRLSEQMVGLY